MIKTIFVILPKLSKKLQNSLSGRMYLYWLFIYFLTTRKIFKNSNVFRLPIVINNTKRSYYIDDPIDIVALREVFVDEEYKFENLKNPDVIVDLGAHIGDTTLYFHSVFPNAKIYAIEASPISFKKLKKNIEGLEQVSVYNFAVSNKSGNIKFYSNASSLGSASFDRTGESKYFLVEAKSLQEFFSEASIPKASLVKFDIEGAEADVFTSVKTKTLSDNYIGEVHLDLGVESLAGFEKLFDGFDLTNKVISKDRRYLLSATTKS